MNQYRLYKIVGCIILSVFFLSYGKGQSPYTEYEVLKNDTLNTTSIAGVREIIVYHPAHGDLNLHDISGDHFSIEYIPDSNFVGRDTFTVEYYTDYKGDLKYLHGVVTVSNSFVHGGDDFYVIPSGSDYTYIDVMANDGGTSDSLRITGFPYRNHLYVNLNNGLDSLWIKPAANYSGKASLIYQLCDGNNACDEVNVHILVIDTAAQARSDTLHLQTTTNRAVNFYMTDSTYSLVDQPRIGKVEEFYNGYMMTYTPFQNIEGVDSLVYSDGNVDKLVIIEILKQKQVNTFVVDDYVYVYPGDTLDFDVFENDIVQNGRIRTYSQPNGGDLTHHDDGNFTFIAPQAAGLYSFAYKACIVNSACEVGNVEIYVGTLAPEGLYRYELSTPKNRPFVINYDVPLSNFSFVVSQAPLHGSLQIYPGIDTLNIGCEAVVGYNLVTYTPDTDYVGTDLFELEYCASDASVCQTVKVEMNVADITLDSSSCICVNNCVWPGDMNADGKVDMLDLLSFGWNLGDRGKVRPFANDHSWHAQYSPNWSGKNVNGSNLKHLDSDGNGVINQKDVDAIGLFFNRRNDITPEHDPSKKEFPIQLVYLGEPNPEIGDYVEFAIVAGTADYPAEFLHGIALHYDVDLTVVDTSSLELVMSKSSFLAYDAMTQALSIQNGRSVDAAITRLDKVAPTGYGRIGVLGFVIEDEIDGIRTGEIVPLTIKMRNSYTIDGFGNIYKIPDAEYTLNISLNNTRNGQDIFIFPNPVATGGQIHARFNPVNSEAEITICNMQGEILFKDRVAQGQNRYDLQASMESGVYIMTIREKDGFATEKFIVK